MCDLFPSAVSLPIHQGQQPGRTTEEQLLREAVGKEPGMGDSTRGCGDVWGGGGILGSTFLGALDRCVGWGTERQSPWGFPQGCGVTEGNVAFPDVCYEERGEDLKTGVNIFKKEIHRCGAQSRAHPTHCPIDLVTHIIPPQNHVPLLT